MPKTAYRKIDPKYLEDSLSNEDYQELLEYAQDLEPGSLSGTELFPSDRKTAPTSPTIPRTRSHVAAVTIRDLT